MHHHVYGPNRLKLYQINSISKSLDKTIRWRIWLQKVQILPLNTHTLKVESATVYTSQGVPISVTGIAQVKINAQNDEMLRLAAEQFGSKRETQIADIMKETFEGHQRAIMGSMTVEQIIQDRKDASINECCSLKCMLYDNLEKSKTPVH